MDIVSYSCKYSGKMKHPLFDTLLHTDYVV